MAHRLAVANRVLSVGDAGRGERVAQHFDGKKYFVHHSHRGFVVYTGRVKEVSALGLPESALMMADCLWLTYLGLLG